MLPSFLMITPVTSKRSSCTALCDFVGMRCRLLQLGFGFALIIDHTYNEVQCEHKIHMILRNLSTPQLGPVHQVGVLVTRAVLEGTCVLEVLRAQACTGSPLGAAPSTYNGTHAAHARLVTRPRCFHRIRRARLFARSRACLRARVFSRRGCAQVRASAQH